jgi:HEAT repeat protein
MSFIQGNSMKSFYFFFFSLYFILLSGSFIYAQEDIKILVQQLQEDQVDIRIKAAKTFSKLGKEAKEAIPALIIALHDKDAEVRTSVAKALGNMGGEAKEAIPALIQIMNEGYIFNGESIQYAEALTRIGKETKEVIPALIQSFKESKYDGAGSAISALGNLGKAYYLENIGIEPLTPLREALKDGDKKTRGYVALALGHLGKYAKDAIPDLLEAIQDPESSVRSYALHSLIMVGVPKEALPILIQTLNDNVGTVRMYAAKAIMELGESAKEAIPALILLLKKIKIPVFRLRSLPF